MRFSPTTQSWPIIVMATCTWIGCGSGTTAPDGGTPADAGVDASVPWETQTLVLASGLEVEVWGPEDELAALPEVPTAGELCESFELSVTVVVSPSDGAPTSFSAAAGYRAAPRGCQGDPDFLLCVPHRYFRDHVAPQLNGYAIPQEPAQGPGYYNHPIGVAFFTPENRDEGSPLFTGLYDSRTAAPLAGWLHDDDDDKFYFHPSTWADGAQAPPYAGDGAWARMVDEPFVDCIDSTLVMTQVMQMFFIEDLDDCGIIFAIPFPLNLPGATLEEQEWCPAAVEAHAVTLLATTEEHPWYSTECPPPEDALYKCYTQQNLANEP